MIIKENYNVPTLVGEIQKIHRQEAVLRPDDFIYIRHETSCYHVPISPSPSTTPLNATRPCNRTSAPDPLGRGQHVLGRNTPLLCVVMVNTTLSGEGQPPPPRKPTRLVGIMSLATGLLCFSVSKIALSSDIDKRIVYRIFFRYPLSDPGIMCSGTPSNIGTCSESRVSAAGYLPRPAENNQLWGIGGLVNRLYLGFYIPHFGGQVHLNMNLSTKMTKKYVTH